MKATIDGELYRIDLVKFIEFLRTVYIKLNNEGIATKDGVVKIDNYPLIRTALKMIMTPLVIPYLRKMYEDINIVLDEPEKHSDLINYAINAYLDYLLIVEGKVHVNIASQVNNDSSKTIVSVTPVREEATLAIGEPAASENEPCNQ